MSEEAENSNNDTRYQTDPVCGMQVSADSPHVIDDCHRRIVFCSSHCLERYVKTAPDIDPVCGMHVPASSPYTLKENERLLRFCSVDCRAVYQQRRRTGEDSIGVDGECKKG